VLDQPSAYSPILRRTSTWPGSCSFPRARGHFPPSSSSTVPARATAGAPGISHSPATCRPTASPFCSRTSADPKSDDVSFVINVVGSAVPFHEALVYEENNWKTRRGLVTAPSERTPWH
jgi:hypothetical protein